MSHKKVLLDMNMSNNQIKCFNKSTYFIIFFIITCYELLLSDYKTGFGGQYGVQNDRQDKSAVGWDHQEKLQKHESQKGKWQLN